MENGTYKVIRAICIALSMLALFLFGVRLGKRQLPADVVNQRDTVTLYDTLTLTEYKDSIVYRTKFDTCYLPSVKETEDSLQVSADTARNFTDSSLVQVPINYIHEKYSDAEVWYHGFHAGIDSLWVYPEKQIITNTITRTIQPSRWALSVHGGYGIGAKGLTPYIGLGLSYDLLRFPKRGRVRSNAGE